MPIAYLCLGSNIEDRVSYIQQVTNLLVETKLVNIIRTSALYETEPWGNKNQPWFLNAVIEVKTTLEPKDLLALCLNVESQLGRDRDNSEKWGARKIDVDILLYGDLIYDDENLTIPHKYLDQRAFALVPLLELIPDFVHPKYKKSLIDIHDDLECPEDIFLYGTRFDFE